MLTAHDNSVVSLAFSPDGTRLVTGGGDGVARLWDLASLESRPVPHAGRITALAFSPDGQHIVAGASDLRAWDDDLPWERAALIAWIDAHTEERL